MGELSQIVMHVATIGAIRKARFFRRRPTYMLRRGWSDRRIRSESIIAGSAIDEADVYRNAAGAVIPLVGAVQRLPSANVIDVTLQTSGSRL